MKYLANRNWSVGALSALALVLSLGASTARADDFRLTMQAQVDLDHISPKVSSVSLWCYVYDTQGKDLSYMQTKGGGLNSPNIDPNVRSFHGVLWFTTVYDMDKAMKTDWGHYQCNLLFAKDNVAVMPTVGNADDALQVLPGAVTISQGSLF